MVDQRGRDNPPIFYVDTEIANYKYHALLTEPVFDKFSLLKDLNSMNQTTKQVDGELLVQRPRGLYGFQRMEERDKFCKRCNKASEIDEYPVCYPVTVPNLVVQDTFMKQIKYQGE